jgi:hypothetical protein
MAKSHDSNSIMKLIKITEDPTDFSSKQVKALDLIGIKLDMD